MANATHTDWVLCRRLLGRVRPYWLSVAGVLLLSLLAVPLPLLNPLPLKIAVDALSGSGGPSRFLQRVLPDVAFSSTHQAIVLAVCLFVIIGLLNQVHGLCNSLLSTYLGEKLVLSFRAELFRHVQRLSFTYHDAKGTTDTTYRIQYDASCIRSLVLDAGLPLVTTVGSLLLTTYVALRIDWQLVLIVLFLAPLIALVTRGFRARFRRQWSEVKSLESSAMGVVQEVMATSRVVKAFGQEHREHDRFFRHSSASVGARLRAVWSEGLYGVTLALLVRGAGAAVLYIAAQHVLSGKISLGDLVMLMFYIMQMIMPLRTFGKILGDMQSSLVSAQRAFALLDETPDVVERPDARPLARAAGAVAFRNVSFAYNGGPLVLRDISCEIPAGARVGIVGKTGAGKTTLVTLLTRCFDPAEGQVLLDGVDLRDYKLTDLRNQFGVVLQEPVLFSSSIAENIAYGRPGASDEEIVAAAKAAGAHDFITRLPEGYDTLVGERGMSLSGGERQRISLARAFLKDAPILILDEPTSSVDVKTEAAIQEAMESLMRGRTTFLISHRLSLVQGCDRCLEIEDGRLVGGAAAGNGSCQRAEPAPAASEGAVRE
jgi:ATP-binding cassette subfamily B protein